MADRQTVSEGILLAAASAAAYAVAFAYRTGYASHFGLPPVLLSPSLGAVLQAGGVVALSLLAVWNVATGIWPWVPRGHSARDRAVRRLLIIALIAAAFLFQALNGGHPWVALLGVLAFFGFFEFLFPLIVNRKIAGYEEKLLAQEEIERNAQKHSFASQVASLIGEDMLRLAVVVALLVLLANLVGARAAKTQTEFYVLADRPGYVVAAIEENTLVLAAFDTKESKLTGAYQIEQLSESHPWVLEKRFIGRLAPPVSDKGVPLHTAQQQVPADVPASEPSALRQ